MPSNHALTGEELVQVLLAGVHNEYMEAAIRLLGNDRDGYWLRRLFDDEDLGGAAGGRLVDRSGRYPLVIWDALERLLITKPAVLGEADADTAVLKVALALVGPWKRPHTSTPSGCDGRRGIRSAGRFWVAGSG